MRAKVVLALAVLALAAIAVWYYYPRPMTPSAAFDDQSQRDITVGGSVIHAEVVSSEASREQGLSGTSGLAQDAGMLFVFERDGLWGIWMKDMNYSIDILWLDAQGAIITVAPDASPDTYPHVFYPAKPARYVIELPAGWIAAHNITVGTAVRL